MKLTVERQIIIALFLAIVSLAAINAIIYRRTSALVERQSLEKEREEALIEIGEILELTTEMEAALRGYVLTEDSSFIAQLAVAEGKFAPSLERLRLLLAADLAQSERLAQLRSLVWERLDHSRRMIEARRRLSPSDPALLAEDARGTRVTERVRAVIEEMRREERKVINNSVAISATSAQWLQRFIFLGGAAALLIVGLMGLGVISEFQRRRRAEDDLQGANAELAQQIELQSEALFRRTGEWQFEVKKRFEAEQLARRNAETANRVKDEFIATVSHELRAPLNAILGWAKLLRAGRLDEETTAKAIETIEKSAENQNRLIDDLLDVSRIVTGKLRLEKRTIAPEIVIKAAIEAIRPAAATKNIELSSHFAQTPFISGDPNRLQQVIWNLLSNAVKFTPKGGRVEVRLRSVEAEVEISVSDNGQGIQPEFLPHVFERFRQADSSTVRRHGGLGLGLAIVSHLVEMHGGTIDVASEGEGRGATFTVHLPASRAPRTREEALETPIPRVAASGKLESSLAGLRILAVDDEDEARKLLTQILSSYGATVISAGSAAEALEKLRREQPHLLISDIGMPEEDGYALISRVRALATEQGGDIPAIALTAYAQSSDREKALGAGFQHHLAKPVVPAELIRVAATLVEKRPEG
jgi:signal transduction histidine kinase/ActR/RegA family two-component response regulator